MAFDVRKILEQFETGTPAEAGVPAWQQESWADAQGFASPWPRLTWAAALRSRAGWASSTTSSTTSSCATAAAIASPCGATTGRSGWQVLGYRTLQEQAARRATEWARQGVKPGAKVCLLYSVGSELLISLAAALGLGACISYLPAQGKRFIARRLALLQPEHIATEPHQVLLVEGFEKQVLQEPGSGRSGLHLAYLQAGGAGGAALLSPGGTRGHPRAASPRRCLARSVGGRDAYLRRGSGRAPRRPRLPPAAAPAGLLPHHAAARGHVPPPRAAGHRGKPRAATGTRCARSASPRP